MKRTVVAVVADMIFASKIRATAQAIEVDVSFPRTKERAIADSQEKTPELIVVDLQNEKIDALEFAREMKADEQLRRIHLLGFLSHVEVELRNEALKAGYDRVVPRSEFSRDLAKILQSL
jgi:CheY-like chemotaxis protein